ncbi:MFS monosaccharide [Fusarium denticulatum]|uniref:MFS monosaccharide n=1 Tax=Fusarium denticulatum TaxID=48507 RepID=A0A8H5T2J5_9HYPO|nr:MFS monosaccharide [Fusarium denticulatum]
MGLLTVDQTKSWMVASKLQKRSLLIAVNYRAGVSIFFFGYDQGLMGGVNQSTDYIYCMGLGHLDEDGSPVITETLLQGGIMAIFYLGTRLGCLADGAFGDKYGCIGTIGPGCLGSRLVNGIGTGIFNGIVPAWAPELADHTSRGTFIAMEFTLNIFGVMVAYWIVYGVSFVDNGDSEIRWRFTIVFSILPLLFLLFVCWAFLESRFWIVKARRNEEALYILERLRGIEGEDVGVAEAEYNDICNIIELEKSTEATSYIHMLFGLRSGKLYTGRRVQLVIWLQIMQCWTGIVKI